MTDEGSTVTVLVGDVGGTHTRLAVAEVGPAGYRLEQRRDYASREHPGLAPIVRTYLEALGSRPRPEHACLGVACPVVDGQCELPNLDWELDRRSLAEEVGIADTRLINDFDAVCHSLSLLGPEDRVELQAGEPRAGGTRAVLGAGTGLGQGFVTRQGEGYRVHPSEGGHADFAPRDAFECELLEFLMERYGRASWERVLSGRGLVALYQFLLASGRGEDRPETREAMEEGDPAAVISRRALRGSDPACQRALERFVRVYGAHAGNLALTVQALGGVFVAGGIAPEILEELGDGPFIDAFRAKGRLAPLMERIPVHVIVAPDVGLVGAAAAFGARAGPRGHGRVGRGGGT